MASLVSVIGIAAMLALAWLLMSRDSREDPSSLRHLRLVLAVAGPWIAIAPIPAHRMVEAIAARLPFGAGK